MMVRFFKRLFCKHLRQTFLRNLYGDECMHAGFKRSLWQCEDCGKLIRGAELNESARGRRDAEL